MVIVRSLAISGLLALQVSVRAEQPPSSGAHLLLEQKWGSFNLDHLEQKVKDGLKEQTGELMKNVEVMKNVQDCKSAGDCAEALRDSAEALKDSTFKQAMKAAGICKYIKKAGAESASKIEQEIAGPLAKTEQDVVKTPEACEAVANKVAAEKIKSQLKVAEKVDVVDRFMKLVIQRSADSLCEGENGIRSWLMENAGLKTSNPEEYKHKLEEQLKGKVGPILDGYTSKLCPVEEERLFELGRGPLAGLKRRPLGTASLLALLSIALSGLGALAARRRVRSAQAEELERLAPDGGDIEGSAEM